MPSTVQRFAELPPQGFAFMTDLQRFEHKVRCAVLEVLRSERVGTWNVNEALRQIMTDVNALSEPDLGALVHRPTNKD